MSDRTKFHDSILQTQVSRATPWRTSAANVSEQPQTLLLHFGFDSDHDREAELARRVANGERFSLEALTTLHGPIQSTEPLRKWLIDNNYQDVRTSPDQLGVFASASVETIANTLDIKFGIENKDGRHYPAALSAPSLPKDIAHGVRGITGLQPGLLLGNHRRGQRVLVRAGASGLVSNAPPQFWPPAVLGALGHSQLATDGSGQTIAILSDTAAASSDLLRFWKAAGVAGSLSRINTINVLKTTLPSPSDEATLDEEWASGVAPGATVNVYAAGSTQYAPLMMALGMVLQDAAQDPSLRILSISMGVDELQVPSATRSSMDMTALRLVALGVNIFASSGDAGSASGTVQYPASNPYVLAVGGTTLVLNVNGSIASETGWNGSGGGESKIFSQPSWQGGVGIPGLRVVPDIAAPADPGGLVIFGGQQYQLAGTSWSTPIWAGLVALINERRASSGAQPLPFLAPRLYSLNGVSGFRDILVGSNGGFNCGVGYDQVTGLGSPAIKALITALIASP